MRPDGSPFVVLTVCTGNICRSPLAEQLLRARLDAAEGTSTANSAMAHNATLHGFTIHSAGTIADDGEPMDETAAEMSRRYGGAPDEHRAQHLRAGLVAESHLVLTATRAHRAAVVQLLPRASRFTFTLNQFARLIAAVDPADRAAWHQPEDVVASAAALRGVVVPPDDERDDDIVDPYQRGLVVHEEAAAEIDADVAVIAAAFGELPPLGQAGA
ncbi:hypothetical protein AX769_10270 [Frondihabitans sp. PAMC 28766]|uniref:arsenate reductase/protein-tyrosine-phosphatase family protein n=1 Tax=Frondihabitans sp. PAMC 28766 TaxID=1795630 RepID=UPI00078B71CF|nr:low molecular weight phosphatase family protein [Frondihabitans sp. PAMC 28766]AMM20461.1 hypothetical protein AX769_10270 [Frondihabitans sp. PAMC 28766]